MQIILDGVLRNDEVRYANTANSVMHAGDLHLRDIIPINLNGVSPDFTKEGNESLLPADVEGGGELRENQIIRDDKIILDQEIDGVRCS